MLLRSVIGVYVQQVITIKNVDCDEKDKVVAQDDLKDTALGNLTGADVPTISLEVYCTVTQID